MIKYFFNYFFLYLRALRNLRVRHSDARFERKRKKSPEESIGSVNNKLSCPEMLRKGDDRASSFEAYSLAIIPAIKVQLGRIECTQRIAQILPLLPSEVCLRMTI